MNDLRRNACPSLTAPMQTGDGLLVRLGFRAGGIAPYVLAKIARAAETFGNGMLEVTRRGSLQVRGLSAATMPGFTAAIAALDLPLRAQVPVETGPLAGVDPTEIADARMLAQQIDRKIAERGLEGRLGPKVSVVIDGGGQIGLSDVLADVRLNACPVEGRATWLVSIGGTAGTARPVGVYDADIALSVTLALLQTIAELGRLGRAKALSDAAVAAIRATAAKSGATQDVAAATDGQEQNQCIRRFRLTDGKVAVGIGLPFGQASAAQLIAVAEAAEHARCRAVHFAPERALLFEVDTTDRADELERAAEAHGFATDPNDARLGVIACAGAPACASAHIATKDIARDIAGAHAERATEPLQLHVSGCEKGCAAPAVATPSIIGVPGGLAELRDRDGKVLARVAEKDVLAAFGRVTTGADGQDTVYATAGRGRGASLRSGVSPRTKTPGAKRTAGQRYGNGE